MAFQNDIEELFRKLKPFLGEEADALWLAYNTQTDSRSKAEIAGLLYSLASRYLNETYEKRLLLNVPDEKEIDGEYRLGNVVYSGKELYPFGLRENEWLRHVAIFGTTGSGKTNCAFLILRELARKGKPFLVFDWKRNYRDLILLEDFKDVKVYTVGRDVSPFCFNPLVPPPRTKAENWLKKLIEIICHAYFLGEGVAFLLQKAIDMVYQEKGVYEGGKDYPTFLDVLRIFGGHEG
jgi:DNA helicase HerA-like ATPase